MGGCGPPHAAGQPRYPCSARRPSRAIGCTLPPHLAKGDDKIKPVAEQCIDLGLPKEEVEKLVAVGDRAALTRPLKKLMGNRITGTALDDRAGCACVIRAAQLANEQNPDCCVMVLCSTKEEVGGAGRAGLCVCT